MNAPIVPLHHTPLEQDLSRMLTVLHPSMTHEQKQARIRQLADEREARELRRRIVPLRPTGGDAS